VSVDAPEFDVIRRTGPAAAVPEVELFADLKDIRPQLKARVKLAQAMPVKATANAEQPAEAPQRAATPASEEKPATPPSDSDDPSGSGDEPKPEPLGLINVE
jgi:hypothetical protein